MTWLLYVVISGNSEKIKLNEIKKIIKNKKCRQHKTKILSDVRYAPIQNKDTLKMTFLYFRFLMMFKIFLISNTEFLFFKSLFSLSLVFVPQIS